MAATPKPKAGQSKPTKDVKTRKNSEARPRAADNSGAVGPPNDGGPPDGAAAVNLARTPLDRLAAYLTEVRSVEAGWVEQAGGLHGYVPGTSPWDGRQGQLDSIKARHGFTPDHPLVRSITAYLREREQIEAERAAEWARRGWPPSDPIDEECIRRWFWFDFLLGNCSGRHFPKSNHTGENIRTPADLWAYIRLCRSPVRWALGRRGSRERPTLCPEDVERVYGAMHQLRLPDAPAPPYPQLTEAESEHELERIARGLERADRARYEQCLAEEEARMQPQTPPTLADFACYQRAFAADPSEGQSGLLRIPVMGPEPEKVIRVHPDRLTASARSLQNAEARYQIIAEAERLELCGGGRFDCQTLEAVKARLVADGCMTPQAADRMPLADVLEFLRSQPTPGPRDGPRYEYTVGEAAELSGLTPSAISKAADRGTFKSRGKGRDRRIDGPDFNRFMRERNRRAAKPETEAQARRRVREAAKR